MPSPTTPTAIPLPALRAHFRHPGRFQGRILESATGTPDLYDFGARSYAPGLGAFTSLDSLHGSAQNPALLNGYLYANANPATLVDPDGHLAKCRYAMTAPEYS